jgi:hypothetical protein
MAYMDEAERYRDKARECLRLAELCGQNAARASFEDIAARYLRLARHEDLVAHTRSARSKAA